jgi:hypothetical protein
MILVPLIQIIAAAYLVAISVGTMNQMGPRTANPVRLAYLSVAAGASAALFTALAQPADATLTECIFVAGVALYFIANRRGKRSPL